MVEQQWLTRKQVNTFCWAEIHQKKNKKTHNQTNQPNKQKNPTHSTSPSTKTVVRSGIAKIYYIIVIFESDGTIMQRYRYMPNAAFYKSSSSDQVIAPVCFHTSDGVSHTSPNLLLKIPSSRLFFSSFLLLRQIRHLLECITVILNHSWGVPGQTTRNFKAKTSMLLLTQRFSCLF